MQAGDRIGGLGSSHTTPCGAAVPARPPTRSSETTHLYCEPQWVTRATWRSTRVVVQRGHENLFPGTSPRSNHFIINDLRMPPGASNILLSPNSTTSRRGPASHLPWPFTPLRNPPRCPVKTTTATATASTGTVSGKDPSILPLRYPVQEPNHPDQRVRNASRYQVHQKFRPCACHTSVLAPCSATPVAIRIFHHTFPLFVFGGRRG